MQTRAVILGLDDEPVVKATIPECYNIQAVSTTTAGMSEFSACLFHSSVESVEKGANSTEHASSESLICNSHPFFRPLFFVPPPSAPCEPSHVFSLFRRRRWELRNPE